MEAYNGAIIVPLDPGQILDPDGFGAFSNVVASGTDGEYYFWFGCTQTGDFIETRTMWRRWQGGVLTEEGTSSTQWCPNDPSHSHESDVFIIDSISPFDTGPTASNGWGVREVE